MPLVPSYRQPRSGSWRPVAGLLVLALAVVGLVVLIKEARLPPPARLEVTANLPGVGRKTIFTVKAHEPRLGLSRLVVTVDGAGFSHKVVAEVQPERSGGDGRDEIVLHIPLGKEATPEIQPGTVTVEALVQGRGTRLRHPAPVIAHLAEAVRLEPPSLAAHSQFIHPTQGGAEVVVYEVGPTTKKDGVRVDGWFFPGAPLPGAPATQRFALFAVPYDMDVSETEARSRILLVAEDELGNRAESPFINKFFRRPMTKDTIDLKDAFMQKVTAEIYSRTPTLARKGNLLDDFLQLNRDLRASNMSELRALAARSAPRFLWTETFLPMQNAAVKGSFADRRAYLAGGKQVDTQDHLGFDLASLKGAAVPAANAGVVVMARFFGVFGNCIVVDHGFGLMSLYAHLSVIGVQEGTPVKRGQELGRTGATGLAGGDHLHFTLILQGLPVSPVEWWDAHWIHDRLKAKLGEALPWKPAS